MLTPALVVMGVPAACYEHLSLGRVERHPAQHKALLVFLLDPQVCIEAQPQRDVSRLHRLPYYSY